MWFINKYFRNKEGQHWSAYEYFNPKWKRRIIEMSKFIKPSEKSVLDLGCGSMWLKEFLQADVKYYGCDYTARDKDTLVCDFSKKEFPGVNTDVSFASGVLEYVADIPWFLNEINKHSRTGFICSYCSIDYNGDIAQRKKTGWVNHFTSGELINAVEKTGFKLESRSTAIKNNEIFRFNKPV